jgi:pyruvate/2-oxoglutarate dehydrogenase complex dihydrolipoamide acyltransferase (E2) component
MTRVIVPMPKVGEIAESGTVLEWLVSEGEQAKAEDPLVVMDTDKVEYEVEAPTNGTVVRLLAQVGDVIAIGAPLCEMEVEQ